MPKKTPKKKKFKEKKFNSFWFILFAVIIGIQILVVAGVFLFSVIGFSLVGILSVTSTTLESHGITWKFRSLKTYTHGKFDNGDPYIVVKEGETIQLTTIQPGYSEIIFDGSKRATDGSMLNIECGSYSQGFDSYSGSGVPTYNEELNVGKQLKENGKLELKAGDFLVTAISRRDFSDGGRGFMDQVSVLTVLSEKPIPGQFRNGYCKSINNETKNLSFNLNDIDISGLRNLEIPENAPAFESVLNTINKGIWIDYTPDWSSRAIHPVNNFPNGGYGREICTMVSTVAMHLHYNITTDQKMELLKYFVQIGIDYYFTVTNGGDKNYVNNGGHCACRKYPILLAGTVLNSQNILKIMEKTGDYMFFNNSLNPNNYPSDYIRFQEDEQTIYVSQYDVDQCAGSNWSPDTRASELIPYTSVDIGLPEWIIRSVGSHGYPGNKHWTATYRTCCNANYWHFVISTRLITSIDAISIWNHPALFDYYDRHMSISCNPGTGYACTIFNSFRNLTLPLSKNWELSY